MKTKRIREMVIEIERVKITASNRQNSFWCEICQIRTEFFNQMETSELAAILRKQNLEIKLENLHFYQPDEEQILVCLNSILNGNNQRGE